MRRVTHIASVGLLDIWARRRRQVERHSGEMRYGVRVYGVKEEAWSKSDDVRAERRGRESLMSR